MKGSFITFGCKVNYAETSSLRNTLIGDGLIEVRPSEKPDVVIINTCTVTNNADKECIKMIRGLYNSNHDIIIIVTGCFAQTSCNRLLTLPGVKAVFGNQDKSKILDFIRSLNISCHPVQHVEVSDISRDHVFHDAISYNDRTRSFLKIQDGCNYWCSYCAIPRARGCSRSDTIENIVRSVRFAQSKRVKEIVITGINVGDYGLINNERKYTLYELIATLDNLDCDIRYRISSIEPNLLTHQIVDFIGMSKHFVHHFHIPLQSGSDKILKLMRRKYTADDYKNKILYIKSSMPLCCIGVDVIVGFPGETNNDFESTYDLLQSLPISYLHVFPYSERNGTIACTLCDKIDICTKSKRVEILRELSDIKRKKFYQDNVGQIVQVLFEHTPTNDGLLQGYSDNYLRVVHKYDHNLVNRCVDVKIISVSGKLAKCEIYMSICLVVWLLVGR